MREIPVVGGMMIVRTTLAGWSSLKRSSGGGGGGGDGGARGDGHFLAGFPLFTGVLSLVIKCVYE